MKEDARMLRMEAARGALAKFKTKTKKAGQAFIVLDKKLTESERQQKREQMAEEARVRAQARAEQLAKTKEEKKRQRRTFYSSSGG